MLTEAMRHFMTYDERQLIIRGAQGVQEPCVQHDHAIVPAKRVGDSTVCKHDTPWPPPCPPAADDRKQSCADAAHAIGIALAASSRRIAALRARTK